MKKGYAVQNSFVGIKPLGRPGFASIEPAVSSPLPWQPALAVGAAASAGTAALRHGSFQARTDGPLVCLRITRVNQANESTKP